MAGRPVRAMAEFQGDGRFHLLPIPFEGEIAETYFPRAPRRMPIIPASSTPTNRSRPWRSAACSAVFNWPENSDRYNRVAHLVNAFFSRFDEFLQPGRHPKWKEVNLAADVPGWERVKPAQDWLDHMATGATGATGTSRRISKLFSTRAAHR